MKEIKRYSTVLSVRPSKYNKIKNKDVNNKENKEINKQNDINGAMKQKDKKMSFSTLLNLHQETNKDININKSHKNSTPRASTPTRSTSRSIPTPRMPPT